MFTNKRKDEDRKPIEQEIAELQRRFRVLENDKRACSEDTQGTIRKQRATIEKLTRENRKMKSELNETRSVSGSQAENKMANETLAKLTEQRNLLQEKLEAEVEQVGTLTENIGGTEKAIFSQRQEMATHGGINASLDNAKAVAKQIRILENRLDKALQNFNNAITANKALREQIDTLRRERVVFDDIYRKLENELQSKKKEMANIIEQANAAYEARDSAQAQMASLKQQADKEHAEFEKEWRELGRLIENDKRMKEFMRTKAKQSIVPQTGELTMAQEDRHRKKITRNAWDTAKHLVTIHSNQEKATGFETAFERIQKATGICDIDELVQNFVHAEDQNFSLFKYNNELSADIEKLEHQIAEYREEYVALSGSGSKKEDTEKVKILETLEEKWNDIDRKAIHYEVKYQESQQTLMHVREGIKNMFNKMNCTQEDLPSGCGSGISESNMMQHLAVIESRVSEMLKIHDAIREDEDGETARPPRPAGGASSNFQIKLPSTVEDYSDDEDDEDEDDQRPFTREELKTKTMRGISKKQKKPKGRGGAQ
jgi:chromosome segregation ATPase